MASMVVSKAEGLLLPAILVSIGLVSLHDLYTNIENGVARELYNFRAPSSAFHGYFVDEVTRYKTTGEGQALYGIFPSLAFRFWEASTSSLDGSS